MLKIVRDGKVKELPVVFQGTEQITGTVDEDGATAFYGGSLKESDKGVVIVSAGNGKLAKAGATDGVIILYVNDQRVSKPRDVIDIAYRSKRAIYIEGVDPTGKSVYFGFAKDE